MWSTILATLCVLLLLRHVWYRRKFYYLSWKIQGPLSLPLIGNSLTFLDSSKVVNTTTDLMKQYKSTTPIRFWLAGHFILYFANPEDVETIMTSPHSLDKGTIYKLIHFMSGGDGLFTMGGEGWKKHRKLLNPTVQNYNILNSFYPKFNKNMKLMTELLEEKVGQGVVDIYHSLEACTLDMICETTFGATMNIQRGENRSFLESANNLMLMAGVKIFQPWYRLYPIYRLSKYYNVVEKSKKDSQAYVKQILDKKIEEFRNKNHNEDTKEKSSELDEFGKTRYNIFIDEIVRLSIDRNCFTEHEMLVEAFTMMAGGFETTALTASYIVLMLALHPEYQERVFQELREIFPDQRSDVTAEDISKFKYTDQFIKETMRFTPTVPFVTRYAKKDIQIGKHTVPEGTELIVSIYHLHRNAAIYGDNAETFDPDHFLPEVAKDRHPFSFVPFTAGIRNCIGMKYGHIVVRLFVAWIVRNYRFTTNLKMEELTFRMNITMKVAQGHMVEIHKRENY
ncbi:probable cytochrome P450 313a4 isoform X1 [Bradysia coprophila]|uniref:probable cytochrome P450 313a4 isoform X1 n=1 Tax=Bradysia coprophila TaxID=38358 RepID=UPI00187DC344|nr:probable cytochrome P450 313a4 isoform X1 [Bradysia coprophila]